jgi:two-component system sensor histidine kinase AtoS
MRKWSTMWKDKHLSFRVQYLLIVLLSVSIPVLVTNFFLVRQAEEALLEEKQAKLFGLARQLDVLLAGEFEDLLSEGERHASREEKIKALSARLTPLTDQISASYPGVGIGYYSAELDAVVAYAPSREFGKNVGLPIAPGHPGRTVLRTGEDAMHIGEQMRGDIMNAMHALQRNGKVIGYTWANELTTDVTMQLKRMERNLYLILISCMVLAIFASYRLFAHVVSFIDQLIDEIEKAATNLAYRLSVPVGVLGRIPAAINQMIRQLEENRTHKEHIFASVRDGIITLDVHGHVTEWNAAMEKLTGIPASEVLGQPYMNVYRHAPDYESLLLQTLETGIEQKAVDTYFPHRDGRHVPVNSSTSLLRSGEAVIGAMVVVRDLTEKAVLEEQMRRADRLKAVGELAAGMAHEIRNPLTSIKAFAQIIEDSLPHDGENRSYAEIIVQEVDRINRIVERLLLFAKPSPLKHSLTSLGLVARETLFLVENEYRRKRLNVDVIEREDVRVVVDPDLMRQVMLNLLLNAIAATPEDGRIEVSIQACGEEALVRVYNQGAPIPDELRERIFNPFFTTKEKGIGLGLSVSQSIVRYYEGRLTCENADGGVAFNVIVKRARDAK